jgi:hypothetical protein
MMLFTLTNQMEPSPSRETNAQKMKRFPASYGIRSFMPWLEERSSGP